jgi:hypothetical protein
MPDGAWKDERCFIVGGGPSLTGFNWDVLKGAGRIIAVNRAVEVVPWADIMFSMDSRLYEWYHERRNLLKQESLDAYDEFQGMKVWLDSHHHQFKPDVYLVNWLGRSGVSLSLKKGIYSGGNSGYSAMMLAVALGCSPIILLGFDMGHDSGRTHFHDGYPMGSCNPSSRTWTECFNEAAPKIKAAGIQVINANPYSNIRCFPFGNIIERQAVSKNYIIVNFYTLDYMESAMRLKRSLDKFGLTYHLQKVERCSLTYQDWQRETFFKANFVRNMLNQYPDKDIVWMDADAEVLQYPNLLGNIPGDLAARIYRGQKLVSNVVYFRNCEAIKVLVDDWITLNQKPQDRFRCEQEQMNLQIIAERASNKIKFVNLPKEYSYIFDERDKCENPVIIQWQASRKFRSTNAPH